MKKYKIDRLFVELTRKCNYKCAHCIRGDAQNLTITADIIDAMFSQCDEVYEISLIGGESLLEIDALKMLLKKIDEYNLRTKLFSIITNGSILDISVIYAFDNFLKKDPEREVSFLISDDSYHDCQRTKEAYIFYKSNNTNSHMVINTTSAAAESRYNYSPDEGRMVYNGRMVDLHRQNPDKGVYYPENYFRLHQICISADNTIKCTISLFANGNISLSNNDDYLRQDERAIGNIAKEALHNIIQRHNDNCPCLCDECYTEVLSKNIIDFDANLDSAYREKCVLTYKLMLKRNEYMWILRRKIKKSYHYIPMRAIIKALPVKNLSAWGNECFSIKRKAKECGIELEPFSEKYARYEKRFPTALRREIQGLAELDEYIECADICIGILKDTDVSEIEFVTKLANHDGYDVDIDVCELIPDTLDDYGLKNEMRQKERQKYGLNQ